MEWFDAIYDESKLPALPDDSQYLADEILGEDAEPLVLTEHYSDPESREYSRADGTPLPELTLAGFNWYEDVRLLDGIVELTTLNYATYYDLQTMNVVFRTYLGYEVVD